MQSGQEPGLLLHLHSIMYLLIQIEELKEELYSLFTFHNVSINSEIATHILLVITQFTFHNVSINSLVDEISEWQAKKFTFHNVSINSH